jgi:energy-coupling factor transporter ATPase
VSLPAFIKFDHAFYRHAGTSKDTPPALNDLSVSIETGEWVAIVGANGSGKTTFARHCNALLLPTSGQVLINGKKTSDRENITSIRSQIGMVFQNPEDQIISTVVEEDTAFGPENLCLSSELIRNRVESSLRTVHMLDQRARAPHLLSAGQMQRVALAGVLAMQPGCVIFDESTAMLDPRGRQDVLNTMRQLHEQGFTVLFITHFMEEAARADRVLVLDQGNLVYDGTPGILFTKLDLLKNCGLEQPVTIQLLHELRIATPALSHLSTDFEKALAELPTFTGSYIPASGSSQLLQAEVLISVKNLNHTYLAGTPLANVALKDVSLEVTHGLAHGFAGATGSGKSTLLQHFNGLYRPQSGQIRVGSFSLSDPDINIKALRRFAGLVFQNPEIYFFEQYVGDEISYGPRLLHGKEGLREKVRLAMEMVGLDFEQFKDRITYTLSGGEKRKVALAATLALQPGLLILDEPTAGLDPVSRRNLHVTLLGLQKKGIELLLSSHSMGDITELTSNLTIMSEGKALRTGDTAELFNDQELIKSASLGQPSVVRLACALRAKGWPIAQKIVKTSQLIASIKSLDGKKTS